MKVLVRLLGSARLELQRKEARLELPEGASVADVVEGLVTLIGHKAEDALVQPTHRGYTVIFSLNGHPVEPTASLSDGDTVTLLPPMAGGAPMAVDLKVWLRKPLAPGDEAHV